MNTRRRAELFVETFGRDHWPLLALPEASDARFTLALELGDLLDGVVVEENEDVDELRTEVKDALEELNECRDELSDANILVESLKEEVERLKKRVEWWKDFKGGDDEP